MHKNVFYAVNRCGYIGARYSETKRETNKDVYEQTMNHNISENLYRHSTRKRKREIGLERRRYIRKIKKENINFLYRCHTLGGELIALVHTQGNYR